MTLTGREDLDRLPPLDRVRRIDELMDVARGDLSELGDLRKGALAEASEQMGLSEIAAGLGFTRQAVHRQLDRARTHYFVELELRFTPYLTKAVSADVARAIGEIQLAVPRFVEPEIEWLPNDDGHSSAVVQVGVEAFSRKDASRRARRLIEGHVRQSGLTHPESGPVMSAIVVRRVEPVGTPFRLEFVVPTGMDVSEPPPRGKSVFSGEVVPNQHLENLRRLLLQDGRVVLKRAVPTKHTNGSQVVRIWVFPDGAGEDNVHEASLAVREAAAIALPGSLPLGGIEQTGL